VAQRVAHFEPAVLFAGARLAAEAALQAIERHSIHAMPLVPTMAEQKLPWLTLAVTGESSQKPTTVQAPRPRPRLAAVEAACAPLSLHRAMK